MIAKHKIIIISVVCFSVVPANQRSLNFPPLLPPPKPGMTQEEFNKEFEKAFEQQRSQQRERNKKYMEIMAKQAWMRLLRVSEYQWKLIEPKYKIVNGLVWDLWTGASGWGGQNEQDFHWNRASSTLYHPMESKARDEMPEKYRIVEELIDLLEDEKSTDEHIRKKIDALHQAREKSREALPEAKKELAAVLTTQRQEAIFLIMGDID